MWGATAGFLLKIPEASIQILSYPQYPPPLPIEAHNYSMNKHNNHNNDDIDSNNSNNSNNDNNNNNNNFRFN